MALDRNANNSLRLRRNQQRTREGEVTGTITVAPPLENTGSQIQLNLDSAGGLENNSGSLRIKLNATTPCLALSASGVNVIVNATGGIQRTSTGISILLPANSGLQTAAGGLSVLLGSNPALTLTSGLALVLDGATLSKSASGVKVADDGIGVDQLGILTTKGDLVSFSTLPLRIPVGADGTYLKANSGVAAGIEWAAPGGGASPLTTKGDVYVFGAADDRLPVGLDGQVLTVDSGEALGVKWATPGVGAAASSFPYDPGASFSIADGYFQVMADHLELTGTDVATLQGTAQLRIV